LDAQKVEMHGNKPPGEDHFMVVPLICPDSAKCPETGIDNVAGRRSGHKIDLLEGDFLPECFVRASQLPYARDSTGIAKVASCGL
jgi:hypothetical protein